MICSKLHYVFCFLKEVYSTKQWLTVFCCRYKLNLYNSLGGSHFSPPSCQGSALSTDAQFCRTFAQTQGLNPNSVKDLVKIKSIHF